MSSAAPLNSCLNPRHPHPFRKSRRAQSLKQSPKQRKPLRGSPIEGGAGGKGASSFAGDLRRLSGGGDCGVPLRAGLGAE